MMSKHIWPLLTELCLLLVLHDRKAMAGGDNTQATRAVNIFQDVGTIEQTKTKREKKNSKRDNGTFEVKPLKIQTSLAKQHHAKNGHRQKE